MLNKNKFENGTVKISNEIINLIASTSALEVKGVEGLAGAFGEVIKDPRKGAIKSTQVEIGRDYVIISIGLVLEVESKIPEITKIVQAKIKSDVENMTGLNVTQVKIDVVGKK